MTANSLQHQPLENKKKKVVKKQKKTVNYTTIRKQVPSFERSVENTASGVKILKYPKIANELNNSSQATSMVQNSVSQYNKKGNKHKSMNFSNLKCINNSKVIRLSKDLKINSKKLAKAQKQEGKQTALVIVHRRVEMRD